MSDTQRYCTVPVAEYNDIDMDQVAATYGREVFLDPLVVANGTERLIGFNGNKPRTLFGYPTYTPEQWKAEIINPESPYYIDPAIF